MDGSGKTTQARLLTEALGAAGHRTVATREPGGTSFGAHIRKLLLTDRQHEAEHTDLMLFLADRAEHVSTVVQPALASGAIVVCDRYAESTLAYQARLLGGDGPERVARMHHTMRWPIPDLTVIYDVDPETAARRVAARATAERDPDMAALARLRTAFLTEDWTGLLTRGLVVIPAAGDPSAIADVTLAAVHRAMSLKHLATDVPRILARARDTNGDPRTFDATTHLLLSTNGRIEGLADSDGSVRRLRWATEAPDFLRHGDQDIEVADSVRAYLERLDSDELRLLAQEKESA
jgi:dTMP kinase